MSNSDLSTFYQHIDDVRVVMMTTRRADGHMQSRAMATQKHAAGADLWFVSYEGTAKLRDRRTGKPGSLMRVIPGMVRLTIRGWC